MDVEPLQLLPKEKWPELEPSLKLDWPRSIAIINVLETLRRLPELCRKFDFKIYCPYGDVSIGVVITCMKNSLYEVIIHCNRELKTFSKVIKCSKIIKWELVAVQFTDRQVMNSIASAIQSRNIEWCHLISCDTLYLDVNIYDIQIPEEYRTYGLLSLKHVTQVNSTWEHRYPGSEWYFEQLIKSHLGYGLFEKASNKLIAWVFHTESGTFENMHVLDFYRRKGYGELLTKITYNTVRKNGREYIYIFCVKGNNVALGMYEKLGVKIIGETFWTLFKSNIRSKI